MKKLFISGNAGFTLVELIVTMGVFGVVMIVGSNFLIQTIKSANQAAVQNEVRQNASVILQDIVAQARLAYCVYYESPSPATSWPTTNAALIRISDDPNGEKCASGNRIEYFQDQSGVIFKTTYDFRGTQTGTGKLTSDNTAILNCSSGGTACGQTVASSCASGLVANTSGTTVTNGNSTTLSIFAQQIPGQTRADNCASVKLTDTITPRIKF